MGDAGTIVGSAAQVASDQVISQNQIASQERQEQENRNHAMKIAQMNIDLQRETNAQNQANWEKSFAYQQQLNQQQMEREDNAVGRRAEDLQNNGFNRLMAVATAADSGQMTTVSGGQESQAAQIEAYAKKVNYQRDRINMINNMIGQAQVGRIKMETEYIGEQIMTEAVEREKKGYEALVEKYKAAKTEKEKDLIAEQIKDIQMGLKIKAHNLGIGKKWKLPVNMDWRPNNAYQLGAMAGEAINDSNTQQPEYKGTTKGPKTDSGAKTRWNNATQKWETYDSKAKKWR